MVVTFFPLTILVEVELDLMLTAAGPPRPNDELLKVWMDPPPGKYCGSEMVGRRIKEIIKSNPSSLPLNPSSKSKALIKTDYKISTMQRFKKLTKSAIHGIKSSHETTATKSHSKPR